MNLPHNGGRWVCLVSTPMTACVWQLNRIIQTLPRATGMVLKAAIVRCVKENGSRGIQCWFGRDHRCSAELTVWNVVQAISR